MKLLVLSLAVAWLFPQGGFHQISIGRLDGTQLQLSSLAGKKVVVIVFDASAPDMGQVRLLDSLQMASAGKLAVIAVPALDLTEKPMNSQQLKSVLAPLSLVLVMTEPMQVKKASQGQSPLFRWLTHLEANTHFNVDVKAAGQLFVVSGQGQLYAVLGSKTPRSLLYKVLQQQVKE